ncbi:SDR family oxidoreductase [Sphingomonas sp.]|uniref:SDR family oxidoreductase n=1 Tax=Sphingomonas sp. TaxID=28214 RepID=UPI0035BBC7A5
MTVAGMLSGRVAAVTGGESGIGAACALALAETGADIALLVHADGDAAVKVEGGIVSHGRRATRVVVDVGEEAQVGSAFDAVRGSLGIPDILVNSAGLNQSGVPVVDMDLAQWEQLLRADLTGSFLTSRRFVRDLRASGDSGAIINITSIHAFAMRSGAADYTAAKGGQANLTRTMALECAPLGITVNAIAPGMILTPMNAEAEDPVRRAEMERAIPAGRAGRPEEIGRLAAFLVSRGSSYITGATIVIDGGLSLLMGQGA